MLFKKNKNEKTEATGGRRLSPLRVLMFIMIFLGIITYLYRNIPSYKQELVTMSVSAAKSWFAPYVDVTAKPTYSFEQTGSPENHRNLVLAFIVSSSSSPCTPTWGNYYTLEEAGIKLDLDRRIARYRQQGGNIAVSFGGLLNDELSLNCKSEEDLKTSYEMVIDHYDVDTVDFDLEGNALTDEESLIRRAKVISALQKDIRSQGKNLAVWLTLPVTPQGLTEQGTNAVSKMLSEGVDLAGVNAMTMDYGGSKDKKDSMEQATEKALTETHRQLGILFSQAGTYLNENSLWRKIGATPMIGQNDITEEIFTLEDAGGLNKFLTEKGAARISTWSANRDIQCGENYVNTSVVSDSCSGIKQDKFAFSGILKSGFDGELSTNAKIVTENDKETEILPDIPEESPYQIWTENGTYLEGTKVVWHHNVYQAKWWTQGDLPDNPVLQYWQTPWQLVGPVLPGEKPIPQMTLPEGTYPTWSGTQIYDAGQRVLFNGIPFQAKWWTQGDSPAASKSDPDASPWVVLTQEQIEKILLEKSASKSASTR